MSDGSEQPIAYSSRSLSVSECKFSQLEKEGLAIVVAIKKFHQFLHGRPFTIFSDHQPLKYLFDESKQVPILASGRIQRWALLLSSYQYKIQYRPGKQLGNADALSRLPLPESSEFVPHPGDQTFLVNHLNETVATCATIKSWTDRDPVISRVRKFVLYGGDICDDPALKPYKNRQSELSVLDGCLLLGSRVIVPKAGQGIILNQLHETHPGITRMKALARCFVWWPGIDADIESQVQNCTICQQNRAAPPKAELHPWEWPQRPWSRLHIDHLGPYLGHTFLLIVDAHSKWIEALNISN